GHDDRRANNSQPMDVATISREHVMAFSGEPASISVGSHRVLESLIGNDEQDFDADLNSSVHNMNTGLIDPVYRSS
ncbi:hypothetical protein, partial [Salmonella enterica]|uniref:hypothetical protein n=2 Tax=Pseudomonadota TaxID=1224 RepID=UPI003075BC5D